MPKLGAPLANENTAGKKDWKISDLPQVHLPPKSSEQLVTVRSSCGTAQQNKTCIWGTVENQNTLLKSHPHVGLVRLSKKSQGQNHVGRRVLQPHSLAARSHGAGQPGASPFQSGMSWSSRGAFPCASPPAALGSGVRGGKRCTTRPWLRWLAPCCWHRPPSHLQLLVPHFASLAFAMALQEAQRVSMKRHGVCKASMREDPSARALLSQTGVAHRQLYPLPGRPRHCWHLPRTPTAATCADSLHKVGALGSWGLGIFLPISARGLRSGAAPWWHIASTAPCIHHCCCHPRGDLCAQPRAFQRTNPGTHIHQQQQISTSGVCRGRELPVPHTTFPCRKDSSSREEVGLGQGTALPASSCRAGSWSSTQGRDHITRWGCLAPNIPGCGTWGKPEPCSVNAQCCYI